MNPWPLSLFPVKALTITRLCPGDGMVRIDWIDGESNNRSTETHYLLEYFPIGNEAEAAQCKINNHDESIVIGNLVNGKDYECKVLLVNNKSGEIIAKSLVRLFRPGKTPGIVINYIHPDDYIYDFSGRSPASPSIARLPDGRLVASHDVYWGAAGQNLSKVFRSEDNGKTWKFITDLFPCFWGKLFVHQGHLYMLACSTEYGALMIGRSKDGGDTWTSPTVIMEAGDRETGGPHRAPMPVIVHKGRIWTSVEYGSWQIGGHATGVVSAREDADLTDAASWTVSPFLAYDHNWPGAVSGESGKGLLEGNIVPTPEGGLVNLLRYDTKGATPGYGRAVMLNVDDESPGATLSFREVIDFHGNMSKFAISFDPISNRYWSLVNRVTAENSSQRNVLTLVASTQLTDWTIVKDILDYEHNGWTEDNTKVGFQYVDWIFDGNDLLAVSRTAINGAYNFHNANYITLHRIENFREWLKQ